MSVTAARGFVAAGRAAGVKPDGALDLALVATEDHAPVAAAGVFTRNAMTAAPVLVSQEHLAATGGRAAAVVLNAGNANAGTGHPGRVDAATMAAAVADHLGCEPAEVLVCSTGLIGNRLPIDRIEAAVPALVAEMSTTGGVTAAEAIRTTDTIRKEATAQAGSITVGGMAKGAAMLAPNMATMLAVLTTDAEVAPHELRAVLGDAVDVSFNTLSVDGCTSTNDTVLLFASGAAGPADPDAFAAAVREVCTSLAEQMAGDAEGATKVVRITVVGATSDIDAERAARRVADSALCKCSWYGQDPYWGRVASELGSAGVPFDQERLSISYGGETVAVGGVEVDHDAAAVTAHMARRHLEIVADLGIGDGRATILTNDLTHAYVDENMGTS
ncbi:MAG: bifunctional glutamate N-acetyltransferase/amino-acid acetyltransferase ArgJ [Acidimicrobiia bacterium]|nr:bifunctional glutamate N-acetyltransferase/amino-acid acetyltransferase ArgJ [Acidimicrobiia bacterium]